MWWAFTTTSPGGRMTKGIGGYTSGMEDRLDESLIRDTICGVELQLIELVQDQASAERLGQVEEAAALQPEIEQLHAQLAQAADVIASHPLDVHGA